MKKEDLIIQRLEDLKESTDSRLDSIDNNLAQHMRRTDILELESLHRDNQKRILLLEEPRKALLLLKSVLVYISITAGCILGVLKLLGEL